MILKAKLLIDTFAFHQEIEWLLKDGNRLSMDAQRAPVYCFLLAWGYRGLGEKEKERQYLSKVVAVAGNTSLGKFASQVLGKL